MQFIALFTQEHPRWKYQMSLSVYIDYAVWRFNTTGVSGNTIQNDISGINSILQDFGLGLNLMDRSTQPLIRVRKGIDRIRHEMQLKGAVVRRALTNTILDSFLAVIPTNDRFCTHARACLSLAKAGGLRAHNYVWTKQKWHIRLKHLTFLPNMANPTKLIVRLSYSKTNQLAEHTLRQEQLFAGQMVGLIVLI